ncbi:hypothetical protein BKA80DRAFT_266678 [Phyllosticta citrichinensis]
MWLNPLRHLILFVFTEPCVRGVDPLNAAIRRSKGQVPKANAASQDMQSPNRSIQCGGFIQIRISDGMKLGRHAVLMHLQRKLTILTAYKFC